MKNIKILNILLLVVSISLLVGCGSSGGGSDSPVYPTPDLPSEYQKAPAFNKATNDVYTYKSNSDNVAVDLPVGSTYLVSITNSTNNSQYISLVSSLSASIRVSAADEPQQSEVVNSADMFDYKDYSEAEIQYRLNFINRLMQKQNSKGACSARANLGVTDHSYEKEGEYYSIWTADTWGTAHLLNNCKLVAVTEHAKFFVDQEYRGSYSPQRELMERIVTEGNFALTKVFDSDTVNIHNFIEENFGKFHDIDNDGKISIIITPYLSYLDSSYLGLFMHSCMLPDFEEPRDQILIAPPLNYNIRGENYVRHDEITNLCHEYQHLVNFSQRFYRDGQYSFNSEDAVKYQQELGFDEGSSVCAEALFRRARGEKGFSTLYDFSSNGTLSREYTGNDKRFNSSLSYCNGNISNVFPFAPFNRQYYGTNGLFMLYLHDRFGKENFKKLIELPFKGNELETAIPQTLGCSNEITLDVLQRDWHFALQHEFLLTELSKEGKSEAKTTDVRFKYKDWLKLNSYNKNLNSKSTSISLSKGATTMIKITPSSASSSDNTFRFFIKSSGETSYKNLEINIIKL